MSAEHIRFPVAVHLFLLEIRPEVIRQHVRAGLERLISLKPTLSALGRDRLSVKVSPTLPQAAVILLDGGTPQGRIQLEFRPYREPRGNSFSLELSASDGRLYSVVERSWRAYFADAVAVTTAGSIAGPAPVGDPATLPPDPD